MKVLIVPFEVLLKVFREFKDVSTDKYEHEFKTLKEVEDWIWKKKNQNFDVLFFSLYGRLAITTYPRNQKGALMDEGYRYEYCGHCRAMRTFHMSPLLHYAVCDTCGKEREGFKVKR